MRPEDFFELDFLELDFLDEELRALFRALPLRELRDRELLLFDLPFLELLDFFFLVAFLVATTILLGGQMRSRLGQVACAGCRKGGRAATETLLPHHTIRRIPGVRTSGSAMSHAAMHVSVPVTANLRIAGAIHA